MLLHATYSLAGRNMSVSESHPCFGEVLEAPVSVISSRGYHRVTRPSGDEFIQHWHIYVGF